MKEEITARLRNSLQPLQVQLWKLQDQHSNFLWAAKGTYKNIWWRHIWQPKLTELIGTNIHGLSTLLLGDSHPIIPVPQACSLCTFSLQVLATFSFRNGLGYIQQSKCCPFLFSFEVFYFCLRLEGGLVHSNNCLIFLAVPYSLIKMNTSFC